MSEHPSDSPAGYTATSGKFIATPEIGPLPDHVVDLVAFRGPALRSAQAAASKSFSRPFFYFYNSFDHVGNKMAEMAAKVSGLKDPKDYRRAEEILMAARSHKEGAAGQAVEALFAALETPQGAYQFRRLLAEVVGFGPVSYANGYVTYMEHEHPWVMPLLDALPPARLAPALASLVPHYIFDPYRTWFYEPALAAFLTGPHGDLRHLEGPTPVRDPIKSEPPFDIKALMSGGTSVWDAAKIAKKLRGIGKAARGDPDDEAREMSQMLGVTVSPKDIDDMGLVGDELRKTLHEARAASLLIPEGGFAVAALREGLTPRAEALPSRLWAPYLAQHFDRFDRALGLEKGPGKGFAYEPKHATAMLRHLPASPARYKDALFRMALGAKKSGRDDAQRLLRGTTGLLGRLAKEGRKKSLDTRIQAAACLGFSGDKQAITVLEDMLADEATHKGQNAILGALGRLGADTRSHAPDRDALISEAEAVFDAAYPEKLRWLADVDLPKLVFVDGSETPVTLGPWFLRLAADLGLPQGGPILDLRLAALAPDSRKALGQAALAAFFAYDTLRWQDMQGPAERPRLLAKMYAEYAEIFDWETGWLRQHDPDRANRRREKLEWPQFRDQITEAKIAKFAGDKAKWEPYLHSANDAKGILGLATGLPRSTIKTVLSAYLGPHVRRTAQAKAVMDLYATKASKPVVAELPRIATEQKQKGLRTHAINLLEDLGVPFLPPDPEPDALG